MNDITIVCCWNNKQQYNILLDSINNQKIKVDIVGIDNSNQVYNSCSKALNAAIIKVKTKYIIFAHQDIVFIKSTSLEQILKYLDKINSNDILGFAGATFNSPFVKTNILVGDKDKLEYGGSERVHGIEECNTLDECLFGGYTSYFKQNKFDENVCYGWHLYTVEICLRTMVNGGKVYVCDVELIHNSRGTIDSTYNIIYRRLCKKYKEHYKYLRTPCCYYSGTSFFRRNFYYLKKKLGLIGRKIGLIK